MRDLFQDQAYALKIRDYGVLKQNITTYIEWSLNVVLEATERAIKAETEIEKLKRKL